MSIMTCLVWPEAALSLACGSTHFGEKQRLTTGVQQAILGQQACPPIIEVAAGRVLGRPAQHLHLLDAQAPRQASSPRTLVPCLQTGRQQTS